MTKHNFGSDGPLFPGTRIVVTKADHDKWLAQLANLDLENFPRKSKVKDVQKPIYEILEDDYKV